MFFPERIRSIPAGGRVLEVGPGATPFPGAQVLLEKRFASALEAKAQNGGLTAGAFEREVVHFDGGRFPFKDKAFDYVICSHVLEHVPQPGTFVEELTRVAAAGYIEHPTIYYEYLYNIPVHENVLFHDRSRTWWLSKGKIPLEHFRPVHKFFYQTLVGRHDAMVQEFKHIFFQGYEWNGTLPLAEAEGLEELCFADDQLGVRLRLEPAPLPLRQLIWERTSRRLQRFRRTPARI